MYISQCKEIFVDKTQRSVLGNEAIILIMNISSAHYSSVISFFNNNDMINNRRKAKIIIIRCKCKSCKT